jgi:hypothetical protein
MAYQATQTCLLGVVFEADIRARLRQQPEQVDPDLRVHEMRCDGMPLCNTPLRRWKGLEGVWKSLGAGAVTCERCIQHVDEDRSPRTQRAATNRPTFFQKELARNAAKRAAAQS